MKAVKKTDEGFLVGYRVGRYGLPLQDRYIVGLSHDPNPEDYLEPEPIIAKDGEHVIECEVCDPEAEYIECPVGLTVDEILDAEEDWHQTIADEIRAMRAQLKEGRGDGKAVS